MEKSRLGGSGKVDAELADSKNAIANAAVFSAVNEIQEAITRLNEEKTQAQDTIAQLNEARTQTAASIEELNAAKAQILSELGNKLNVSRVTRSSSVTEDGWAVDARELNPSIPNTMSSELLKMRSILSGVRFLGGKNIRESELDKIATNHLVEDYAIYFLVCQPLSSENGAYVFGGTSFIVIGMEYASHKYGVQFGIGMENTKKRMLSNGIWNNWIDV